MGEEVVRMRLGALYLAGGGGGGEGRGSKEILRVHFQFPFKETPTSMKKSPFSLAVLMRSLVSSAEQVSGFSQRTGLPAANIILHASTCLGWIVPTYTTSICMGRDMD